MTGNASYESFSDIDEQAARLIGHDQRYQQLGKGRFRGQFVTRHLTEHVSIFMERCNLRLLQQGGVPSGSVSLHFLLSASPSCVMNGRRFSEDSVIFLPGGASWDHIASADMRICVISFPADVLAEVVPTEQLADIFVNDRVLGDRLRALVNQSAYGGSGTTQALIGVADSMVADELSSTTREFVAAYHSGASSPRPVERGVYNNALSLIESQLDSSIRIGELCRSIGVSRRTLENAFLANMGHGPARYIRLARLNAIHRRLRSEEDRNRSIGDIAAELGVWHLGRLSQDFRDLFGEGPRELRQRTRSLAPN
jgi:AraC family ethanolamine operon transcriptional activator